MSKTLGGATFVYNGIKQDYCFIEALNCLYELCDHVAICYGGTDGTIDVVNTWANDKPVDRVSLRWFDEAMWQSRQGREKLSYFSNAAIELLKTDWVFYLQADEIIHENSFSSIRKAIEEVGYEAHLCSRFNLWGSPYTMLDVHQKRKPCSSEVFRLAKSNYRCVGDAESLGVVMPAKDSTKDIHIYHMGFVRDSVKHLEKIRHIQDEVFLIEHDKRIDGMEKFDPWKFYSPQDVIPILQEGLPKFIKQWADERT